MPDRHQFISLLRNGNKLGAIKALVEAEGTDLRTAKDRIETLEKELKAVASPDSQLASASMEQERAEMVLSKRDLSTAITSPEATWAVVSFEKFPMGWRAQVNNGVQDIWFSSERGDLTASRSSKGFTEEDRQLASASPQALTHFQQIRYILDKVQQNAAEQPATRLQSKPK